MADHNLKDDSVGVFNGGSVVEATTHLKRFELMATLKKWEPAEKLARFRISMGGSASLWDTSLAETDQKDFDAYVAAFKKFFVKGTAKIIAEQELFSFKLADFQDINALWAALLAKGSEAGVTGEQLTTPFLNALPHDIKIHCLGTDDPKIENFLSRAKLYAATKEPKKVVAPVIDPQIVALTKQMDNLRSRFDKNESEKGKNNFAPRRPYSPRRQNSPRRFSGPRRSQTPFRRGDRQQSPDRRRRPPSPKSAPRKPLQCYHCHKIGHIARDCWHK